MADIERSGKELRVFLRELLGNFGFNSTQIGTVLSGMDAIEESSIALGELPDAERAQLSSFSSPMMAMLLLEIEDSVDFEETYSLLGDLLGEIIRATYYVGMLKGRNGETEDL